MVGGGRGDMAEAAEAMGLILDESDRLCEVYPENWPAVELFAAMGTQWRTGMAGATGLDYAALPAVMDMLGVDVDERRSRFSELRVMERAALTEMNEQREARRG